MNKPENKRILFIILIVFFLAHLVFRIYGYRERYLTKFNPEYWKERYLQSQWVDPISKNPIGDDGLYTYAAWEYIHGSDPTLINPETSFIGKYLLGITILIFRNENIFALITGLLTLGVYFQFNKLIFKSNLLSAIPVIIFSFDLLFYEQLRAPFLDTLQLLFLLLVFYFFLKGKYFLSSVFIGMFASSKFPFMAVLPIFTLVINQLVYKNKKQFIYFIINLPAAIFIYITSYLQFFLLGNSFYKFLSVQKYIFNFYQSGASSPFFGTVMPLIVIGDWYTHFQTKLKVIEWNLLWPISSVLSVISLKFWRKFENGIVLNSTWIIIYVLFLCFTPVFPRYLLLLLPFLYNLAVWVILKSTKEKFFLRLLSF